MNTSFTAVKICNEEINDVVDNFLILKYNALEPLDHLDELSPCSQSVRNRTLLLPYKAKKEDKTSSYFISSAFNSSANSFVILECESEIQEEL